MISLKELIEQGTKIREGISFVPPGKGLRTFKVYKLADSQCYTDWKGLVNRYLQVLHVGAEAEEVKKLFSEFERYNNRPETLDEILGILKAIAAISESVVHNEKTIVHENKGRKVLIVHGHNEEYIQKVARFLEKLECEPIILKEQPNSGKTIIEKFEDLSNAAFGVVLYTACDMGSVNKEELELKPRARQNVIFEHGYLFAKLGREKVCALVEDGVEIPSDLSGVLYVQIDNNDSWKLHLAKEMVNAGLELDMNKAL